MKKDKKDMDTTDQHGKSRTMKATDLTDTQAASLTNPFTKGMRHVNRETARMLRNAAASSTAVRTVGIHPRCRKTVVFEFRDGSRLSVTNEGDRCRISTNS